MSIKPAMETLTIRYPMSWLTMMVALGFVSATAIKLMERGPDYVFHTWSDPLFWGFMAALSCIALIVWAIPAARLSTEGITIVAYPFGVRWNEIQRVKVTSLFGLIWLRVYGSKSRFPIWVPLPQPQLESIHMFMNAHAGDTVTNAFSDDRLKQTLQQAHFVRR